MVICDEHVANHVLYVKTDESGLGIYLKIEIKLKTSWL